MLAPSVGNFRNQAIRLKFCFHLQGKFRMFRLKFLLPSSGKFSNQNILKYKYGEKSLKMETKIVVESPGTKSCRQMAQAFTLLVCSSKRFRKMAPHLSTQILQQMALTSIFFKIKFDRWRRIQCRVDIVVNYFWT